MLVPILVFLGIFVPATAALAQTETPTTSLAPATTGVHHYAVTLLSSFEPIPSALLPTDIKGHHVYRTQSVVFGKTIYFVRLGFFATSSEATTQRDMLLARYPGAFMTQVTNDEYLMATAKAKVAGPSAPATPPTGAPREEIYVVTLAISAIQSPAPAGPLPADLAGKRLYLRDSGQNGTKVYSLQLGFFATEAEAKMAKNVLLSSYPNARVQSVSKREREDSAHTQLTIPASAAVEPSRNTGAALPILNPSTDIETQATELLQKSRAALTRNDNASATQLLNELLRLPPNSHSPDAQELIGLAHQRNGELALAKREYELCLKLYPDWSGAERVRQRLGDFVMTSNNQTLKLASKKAASVSTVYGGISQYYYHGNSRVDSTETPVVGPPQALPTFSATDQSSLISNLDLTGRFRGGDFDNRVVVRDSFTKNFLENADNVNRLYSAYAEVRNIPNDYYGRLGRQSGNSGGVLGRFDGISLGYGFLPKWRINVVAGEPVGYNAINSEKQFWGTSLDFGTFAEHWNGNLYYIHQTVDKITDRQAVGTELRYFDPRKSLISLFDYDVSYGALNIALIQANLQVGEKTNLNVLVDHRNAPILTTSNALIGETNTSVTSLLQQGLTEEQLRSLAEERTPISDLLMIGATHNINPNWQFGGDIKLYKVSGTPTSGAPPATVVQSTEGTGNTYVYTVQGIATGLLTKRDVSVLSFSYITDQNSDGSSTAFTNRTPIQDRWTIDLSLVYYTRKSITQTSEAETNRLTPIVRVGYRWRDKVTFELEAGMETGQTTSSTQSGAQVDDIKRSFYSLGYRWDF